MLQQDLISQLAVASPSKIIMLVIDGLGGLKHPGTGKSELETAHTPNMDRLASEGICGLAIPVGPGISPGSGPGHMALFGYDPVKNLIKRGLLEATGIGLEIGPKDLAVRGNFCTVDKNGLVTDRRAGRIPTLEAIPLCQALNQIKIPGVQLEVHPVKDHRFALILHGDDLNDNVTETDPQLLGKPTLPVDALSPDSQRTAYLANEFLARAKETLGNRDTANMVMLRGFSKRLDMPSMAQLYKLSPACVAVYPMYKGIARLVGMQVLDGAQNFKEEVAILRKHYKEFDFFYLHFKGADTAGEDGDFDGKVKALEEVDRGLAEAMDLDPDVFIVAGDHSTPAILANHSWHPAPFLLRSKTTRNDEVARFTERACASGVLGTFPATQVMSLALAHALKLARFGA